MYFKYYTKPPLSLSNSSIRLVRILLPYIRPIMNIAVRRSKYFLCHIPVLPDDVPVFVFKFSLMEKAKWLNGILEKEKVNQPVIIGQSMGGYVGQAFMEQFPGKLKGFISIDSAPLQKQYVREFTKPGWSVLELWPAFSIHAIRMPEVLCQALLYLFVEPCT